MNTAEAIDFNGKDPEKKAEKATSDMADYYYRMREEQDKLLEQSCDNCGQRCWSIINITTLKCKSCDNTVYLTL